MKQKRDSFWRWLGGKLRKHFLAGFLLVVPLSATVLILVWVFNAVDNILQPLIRTIMGRSIPGVGFGITILMIYLIGALASNIGGRQLVHLGEALLKKVPVVRPLYTSIKQILESFSKPQKSGLLQAVLVEFPRKGAWTIGFVTKETPNESGGKQLNIFVPTAPNPTSGFLQIVNETEVIRTDIPIKEALNMVISAGRMLPQEIIDKISKIS